jgi:hypothetical protein
MTSRRPRDRRWVPIAGWAVTASGIAHLLYPQAFESVNRLAFKGHIRAHVLINGSIEAALGFALFNSRTRRAATAATVAEISRLSRQESEPEARVQRLEASRETLFRVTGDMDPPRDGMFRHATTVADDGNPATRFASFFITSVGLRLDGGAALSSTPLSPSIIEWYSTQ